MSNYLIKRLRDAVSTKYDGLGDVDWEKFSGDLIEEADAINWYEQRISVEKDNQAKAIMLNAQQEEFKHFGMDLEFLLRQKPVWRKTLQAILFKEGDIVELGKKGEEAAE